MKTYKEYNIEHIRIPLPKPPIKHTLFFEYIDTPFEKVVCENL
jgi:hypothetical protein